MAKHAVDNIDPDPPIKVRRFPWRLWLYALVMTAAAGAGGYFTWHYRNEAAAAANVGSEHHGSLKTLTAEAAKCKEDADKCRAEASAAVQKLTELNLEHGKIKNERDQLAKSLTV